MILKKKIYKIATILPYKESYTFDYASAVSLWVSEYFKKSKFRNNNYIYGNTKPGKYLTKNYINIPLSNLKFRFKSTSSEYTEKLIIELNKKKFEIIEVHNRPLVLFKLLDKIKSKFNITSGIKSCSLCSFIKKFKVSSLNLELASTHLSNSDWEQPTIPNRSNRARSFFIPQ